jgi:hypothetical protein
MLPLESTSVSPARCSFTPLHRRVAPLNKSSLYAGRLQSLSFFLACRKIDPHFHQHKPAFHRPGNRE